MNHILVVLGHPDPNSFVAALARAYVHSVEAFAAESGAAVRAELLVLADLVFDPVLHRGYGGTQALEPDLLAAREAIERANHVAWFFPTWWAAPPALVKGFIDRTFLPGWAFAYGAKALPEKLLRGRSARFVTTMDSPSIWYRFAHGRAMHRSFVDATLAFVGFAPIRETTFHGVRTMSESKRCDALAQMAREAARDAAAIRPRTVEERDPDRAKLVA